jgi:hypothetical protein
MVHHTEWDALDQIDDAPTVDEKLYAYQICGPIGTIFLDGKDKSGKRIGRSEIMATYRLVGNQPTDAEMRSTFGWKKWCKEEADRQGIKTEKMAGKT